MKHPDFLLSIASPSIPGMPAPDLVSHLSYEPAKDMQLFCRDSGLKELLWGIF